jgi:hypothetical protein
LKVTKAAIVRKERRLPLPGDILVEKGAKVNAEDIVAKTELPGNVQPMNVSGLLSIPPEDIPTVMLKKEGDAVKKDEPIAQSKGFFGIFKSTVTSPADGVIENISNITGQIILREKPIPVQVDAYIDSTVVEIIPRQGVIVETKASFLQGIFGIGGERIGQIKVVVDDPKDELGIDLITPECKDKVLVGGSFVTYETLEKAAKAGAAGVVVGGTDDHNLRKFLGYDIGVAITGTEQKGVTLVLTEGFGRMKMADRTFNLFRTLDGRKASINGATQIRAGVIRPEVIVPGEVEIEAKKDDLSQGLVVGSYVRVIREPFFGQLGKVTNLPPELQKIETEAKVRVLELELDDGQKAIIPRANVEIIEG